MGFFLVTCHAGENVVVELDLGCVFEDDELAEVFDVPCWLVRSRYSSIELLPRFSVFLVSYWR